MKILFMILILHSLLHKFNPAVQCFVSRCIIGRNGGGFTGSFRLYPRCVYSELADQLVLYRLGTALR